MPVGPYAFWPRPPGNDCGKHPAEHRASRSLTNSSRSPPGDAQGARTQRWTSATTSTGALRLPYCPIERFGSGDAAELDDEIVAQILRVRPLRALFSPCRSAPPQPGLMMTRASDPLMKPRRRPSGPQLSSDASSAPQCWNVADSRRGTHALSVGATGRGSTLGRGSRWRSATCVLTS